MIKKLIAPLQKILLHKAICPGCTLPLKKSSKIIPKSQKEDFYICKCGRIFVFNKELDSFRRALENETNEITK